MHKTLKFMGLAAIAALAALLYTLRHTDNDGRAATAADTAVPVVATPATGSAAPAIVTPPPAAADTALPDPAASDSAIPAFASGQQREATRELRQQSLPAFLHAAEVTLAQVRADIEKLKARGAPAAEIEAAEARLQRLTVVREQVLARNADIAGAH